MNRRAIVVGAGPNGLTAAALLAKRGVDVTIYERDASVGGAARSAELFGEGYLSDLGAAAHPFGIASPIFRELDLEGNGLTWVQPDIPMAHPLPGGRAAMLHRDIEQTVHELGVDGPAWRLLHEHFSHRPFGTVENAMGPLLRIPPHPVDMARLGLLGALPAATLAGLLFKSGAAKALFAGSSAHPTLPLTRPLTAAFGIAFGALAHSTGWPVARGGSASITDALARVLLAHGGRIETSAEVTDLRDLPEADAVLLDLTPKQILSVAPGQLEGRYAAHLANWKYGVGVHKIDYLLDGAVPWADPRVASAGTVHVGGRMEEIVAAERAVNRGRMPDRPFVMVTQQSNADPSRTRDGKQVLWAYAHVPNGGAQGARAALEAQIERFAPGFADVILERREWSPTALEAWNPNLVGGDIGGGTLAGTQQLFRPAPSLHPYRAGRRGLYVCSSSTPPGGGVHGMPGMHAARAVLRDWSRGR
ncbi:NAD(P)/FAD-dependent oxidoreductase [Pseudoclavibacter sp. RFBA6]|uniref:phytoene desaturase family protein n=1 Tax=Pseudoclavibacter sp. RFBA6 TaxID=2080573 RepID=UPI000CE895BF|nr:NAD(P)/FAD-dependent oxidoreductase [Pseudoclavibacter sp. RFBA6]PPG39260.1 FAD-dependent oxidoreductase [Pseudoclavibacter sp. RFBA6]